MSAHVEILSEQRDSSFPVDWYEMATQTHFWMIWRFQAILTLLEQSGLSRQSPLHVLDVGGGMGVVKQALESATQWTVDAADLNYEGLQKSAAGRGRSLYYDIHERRAELVGKYDLVLVLDVIEHVEDPVAFLQSAAHHLKPGGRMVVNVPALKSAFSEYDRQVGHLRRYNRKSLNAELRAGGLEPVRTGYWGMSLVPLLFARKLVLAAARNTQANVVEIGFQPANPWINRALVLLACLETLLVRRPLLGTSVLSLSRKLPA